MCDVESKLWTRLERSVVPKGRNEGSLAVYRQELVYQKTRPVRYGLNWSTRARTAQRARRSHPPHQIRLGGDGLPFDTSHAVNCQATIVLSLRDKEQRNAMCTAVLPTCSPRVSAR